MSLRSKTSERTRTLSNDSRVEHKKREGVFESILVLLYFLDSKDRLHRSAHARVKAVESPHARDLLLAEVLEYDRIRFVQFL